MSSCCQSDSENAAAPPFQPKKHPCPNNGQSYASVDGKTLRLHIKKPWQSNQSEHAFYFCEDPHCHVVYYSMDNTILTQQDLRTSVGLKSQSPDAVLCYCFDVTRQDFTDNPQVKDYVIEKTKNKQCACDIKNPSGKCCLKNFKTIR